MRKSTQREIERRHWQAVRTAAILWSFWWHLPPSGRRQLLALARRHGPWLVRREYRLRRSR